MNAIASHDYTAKTPLITKDEAALFISREAAERFAERLEKGKRYVLLTIKRATDRLTHEQGFIATFTDTATGITFAAPERWMD